MSEITCESGPVLVSNEVPVLARLKSQKENLEQKLSNINQAISQLEKHPEVYDVLEALNKVGRY